jgi:hypothetical protein
MFNSVPEDQCSICSAWPAAERAERRREHFVSDDYVQMPIKGVCDFLPDGVLGRDLSQVERPRGIGSLGRSLSPRATQTKSKPPTWL